MRIKDQEDFRQLLVLIKILIPDQVEGLWFREELLEEHLRSICTR